MSTTQSSTVAEPLTGKRKRNEEVDPEIEIDVNLPEPPSKKALRKAKKQKSSKATVTPNGIGRKTQSGQEDDKPEDKLDEEQTKLPKRSDYGVWIGNLPWSCDRIALETFFVVNSPNIDRKQITRIHMPAPPPNPKDKYNKPVNKGFAYVDFDSAETLEAALLLSETPVGGRKVLIKNSKDFGGRPDPVGADGNSKQGKKGSEPKAPTDRIFVGNLSFEVTKEEIREHFEQCGQVTNVFLATFEDSGKCKGYGWVTFTDIEGAKGAQRGYIMKQPEDEGSDEEAASGSGRKLKKPRKWFVNKLHGRPLRCEFAEDASTRYNKRFGKGRRREDAEATDGSDLPASVPEATEATDADGVGIQSMKRKHDARTIKPGAAHMNAQRSKQGIVESTGKKIVFD